MSHWVTASISEVSRASGIPLLVSAKLLSAPLSVLLSLTGELKMIRDLLPHRPCPPPCVDLEPSSYPGVGNKIWFEPSEVQGM